MKIVLFGIKRFAHFGFLLGTFAYEPVCLQLLGVVGNPGDVGRNDGKTAVFHHKKALFLFDYVINLILHSNFSTFFRQYLKIKEGKRH